MYPDIRLQTVTREDVSRLAGWLADPEVNAYWYGLDEAGTPLHIGYAPNALLQASAAEWQQLFDDDGRRIYSIYSNDGEHLGEAQLVLSWPLLEAQLFLLIGRKDLWHHHYGTSALVQLLDQAFGTFDLHRVWVDVPEYNQHALDMFRQVGFVLEGHFRRAHRKDNEWYDSIAMGLLADEYTRRRARLMGSAS